VCVCVARVGRWVRGEKHTKNDIIVYTSRIHTHSHVHTHIKRAYVSDAMAMSDERRVRVNRQSDIEKTYYLKK
jgi:hypothetical protein